MNKVMSVIKCSSALAPERGRTSHSVQVLTRRVDVALARQHMASVRVHALHMYLLQEAAEVFLGE